MRILLLACFLTLVAAAEPAKREKSAYQGGYEKRDFEVPAGWAKPTINGAIISKDAKVGFNLHLKTENWDFDTSHLGDRAVTPQGHKRAFGYVHLYVNGRKRNRLYGPDFYLKEIDLDPGLNKLEFVLATPQHGCWRLKGKRLAYNTQVTRP